MWRSDARPLSVLTIAGSDSHGGAGIQADLKEFAAHGLQGLCAVAALTAQHTRSATAVHILPVDFRRAQIDACLDDFRIGAVKLGMLANKQVIDAVADVLEHHRPAFVAACKAATDLSAWRVKHTLRPGRSQVAVLNISGRVAKRSRDPNRYTAQELDNQCKETTC